MNGYIDKIKTFTSYKDRMWIIFAILAATITGIGIVNRQWVYSGLLLIPLLIYLCIKKPFIFPFGIYVLLLPFEPLLMMDGSMGGSTFTKLLGMLTIIVFVFTGVFEKKLKKPSNVTHTWMIFIAYSVLTALWAKDPKLTLSIYTFQTLIGLFLLYYVVSSYETSKKDYETIKSFILLGGLSAALYLVLIIGSVPEERVSIAGGPSNGFAFSLLIPIAICLEYLLKSDNKLIKSLFLASFGLLLYSVIISGSRGGFLGAAMIIVVFILFMRRRLILALSISVIGIILLSFIPDFFFERWKIAVEGGGAGRLSIWIIALHALGKYWPFGVGLNNFPLAFDEFAHHYTALEKTHAAAHSFYIGIIVELGIIGFALLIIVLVKHYKKITKHQAFKHDAVMLKASFVSLLVSSLFMDTLKVKTMWLLWTMIMMHRNYLAAVREEQR